MGKIKITLNKDPRIEDLHKAMEIPDERFKANMKALDRHFSIQKIRGEKDEGNGLIRVDFSTIDAIDFIVDRAESVEEIILMTMTLGVHLCKMKNQSQGDIRNFLDNFLDE